MSINKFNKKKGVAKVEGSDPKTNSNKTNSAKANTTKTSLAKDTKKELKDSKPKKMKLPVFRKLHIRPAYLVSGALLTILLVFFARVAIWEHNYMAAMEGTQRDTTVKIEVNEGGEGSDVDDKEPTPTEIVEYVVAPDKPRYFSIPYLGINKARIVEIGLVGPGEMGTPYNIYDVGWYTGAGSVLPGQNGVSILNAHGGNLGYGIFRTLPKLPIGETIRIEMGDGRIYTYKVVESVTKELGDDANNYMNVAFQPIAGASNTLTLITCTGDWWESSQTYSQRLFVRAVLQ